MVHILLFALICLFISFSKAKAQSYDLTPACTSAYNNIMDLQLTEARQLLHRESRQNPDNLMPILFANYADFIEIFTTESQTTYDNYYSNKAARLNQIQERGNSNSPYHRYIQAEIFLQWAFLEMKSKDYLTAMWDFRKAYLLLTQNHTLYPNFMPNKKSLGLLHVLIGAVPDQYQWAINLAGLEGNINKGLKQLQQTVTYGQKLNFLFHQETVGYYSALMLHIVQKEEKAWQIIKNANFPDTSRIMTTFAAANTALFTAHNENALRLLADSHKEATQKGFPYITFLYGIAKMQNLSQDADAHFRHFLNHYQGQDHIKEAWQKIAWYHLLQSDSTSYKDYLTKAGKQGRAVVDGDKQAQREVERDIIPHPVLLRARLLSDGGYYNRADSLLAPFEIGDFTIEKHRIEFAYRQGRILDEWGKPEQAIPYYKQTIQAGKNTSYYYAANAALHLGYIYRSKGKKQRAVTYFKQCQNMKGHPYENSIDQKAKAAIGELN